MIPGIENSEIRAEQDHENVSRKSADLEPVRVADTLFGDDIVCRGRGGRGGGEIKQKREKSEK